MIHNSTSKLPDAIISAVQGATIEVETEALGELGRIACAPDRLDRPDLTFLVVGTPQSLQDAISRVGPDSGRRTG